MKVKETIQDGIGVLSVSGKMMGGPDQRVCHDHIKGMIAENMNWVVLDLGKVEWLNSSGLGMLIGCLTSCRNVGGEMVVARAGRKVNSLFMLTQVLKVFQTFETVEEAVAYLKEKREMASGQSGAQEV
jgi:anti-sigma B factor antagonist